MNKTKNNIGEANRKKLASLLNKSLASSINLKLNAKQAHWNVKGKNFIALHELFDKVSSELENYVDTIAERVVQLGGVADGTIEAVSTESILKTYPKNAAAESDHVEALSTNIAKLAAHTRDAIDQAEKLEDKVTADLYTEITGGLDKLLWFVDSHNQK